VDDTCGRTVQRGAVDIISQYIIFGLLAQYVAASKRVWNHFVSEKHKTEQSFKLHFLQNSPLVHLCTSTNSCNGVENIPESLFSSSLTFLMVLVASQKRRPFNADFSGGIR
jgi:hypothetical protein